MRDKRTDADHVGLKVLHEKDVLVDIFDRLVRGADHDAASDLKSDLLQIAQALFSVRAGKRSRMEHRVMLFVRRLVTKEISVRAGIVEALIALIGLLADRERDRAVRVRFLDLRYDLADFIVGIVRILAALKYKGLKAQLRALIAARKDLFFSKAVAARVFVAAADPAVIAVVFTVIGELDQAAKIDVLSENGLGDLSCGRHQVFFFFFRSLGKDVRKKLQRDLLFLLHVEDLVFKRCTHFLSLAFVISRSAFQVPFEKHFSATIVSQIPPKNKVSVT